VPPINKFRSPGARPPFANATPAAVVAVSKLSDASYNLDGNITSVACLSAAFFPGRLNQSTIDDYTKGGALVLDDISAPLKLLLTQEQNRKSLPSLMRRAFAIGDEREVAFFISLWVLRDVRNLCAPAMIGRVCRGIKFFD